MRGNIVMKRIANVFAFAVVAIGLVVHAQAAEKAITSLKTADDFTKWVLGADWTVEVAPKLGVCGVDGRGAKQVGGKIADMLPIPYQGEVWQLELEVIGDHTARLMVRGETGPILAAYRYDYSVIPASLKKLIAEEREYPGASVNRTWEYPIENGKLIFRGTGPKNRQDSISFSTSVEQPIREAQSVVKRVPAVVTSSASRSLLLLSSPTYDWTREYGTSGSDIGVSVVSEDGDVYVAGEAAASIAGEPFQGVMDFVLRKYNSAGTVQWTRMWGSTSTEETDGIAKYGTNLYVSGNARASVAGQPYVAGRDFCLTKYSTSGTQLWVRMRGTSGYDYGRGVAVDSAGNVYFGGPVGGSLDSQTNSGGYDACLMKYDAAGNWQWTRIWGSSGNDKVFGVAADGNDNIYVAGTTAGSFGGQTNAGNGDLFVSKFNADGNRAWDRIFGTTNEEAVGRSDRGNIVGVDPCGYVSLAANSGPVGAGGDALMRRYDTDGNFQWSSTWGSTNIEYCTAVHVDKGGDIVVAGTTYGSFDGQSYSGTQGEIFLSRYSSGGSRSWSRIWGSSVGDFGFGVCISTGGEIFVTGAAGGSIDGQSYIAGNDIFVSKFTESVGQIDVEVASIAPKPGKEYVVAGTTLTKGDFIIVANPLSCLGSVNVSPLSFPTAGVYRVVGSSGSSAATTTVTALQSDSIIAVDDPGELPFIPMTNGVPVYTTALSQISFDQLVMMANAQGSPLDQVYDLNWNDWSNAVAVARMAESRGMLDVFQGMDWADIKARIFDPVNGVQGNFYADDMDLRLAAPDPLEIRRSYSSDNLAPSDLSAGWHLSRSYFIFANNVVFDLAAGVDLPTNAEVRVSEPDGTAVVYSRNGTTPANVLSPNASSLASDTNVPLNNVNANGIGARANLLNNRIVYVPSNRSFYVHNGQGAVRRFDWQEFGSTNDPAYRKRPYLVYEQGPNGNRIGFTYTTNGLPSTIRATDNTGATIFTSVSFQYNAENKLWRLTASDGRTVNYYYDDFGDLDRVVRPDGTEVAYSYEHLPLNGTPTTYSSHRITRIQKQDNRILENEYFQVGETVNGQVLTNGHYLVGRVKLQKVTQASPSALVTNAWFYYSVATNSGDPATGSGFTEVYDALKNKTVYRFDTNRQITAVERHVKVRDANGNPVMDGTNFTYTLYSAERRYWNGANLVRTALEDASSSVVFNWGGTYDDRGNLLSEKISGNLSGDFLEAMQFDTNGLPVNGESVSTLYTYTYNPANTNDEQNLLTSITRPNASVLRFAYASPSNSSLIARYACQPDGDTNAFNNGIYSREFYEYNTNQVLTKRIADDGTASNKTDMAGVSQRRIYEVTPGVASPCYGLPATAYDTFYNGASDQMMLRHDFQYDSRGNPTNVATYDSTNGFRFSTSYGYDLMNRQRYAVDANGGRTTNTFDDNGNLTAIDGPMTNLTDTSTFIYDYANRLLATVKCDGYGNVLTNKFAYDGYGNEVARTNLHGQATHSYYDDLHRRTAVVLPGIITAESNNVTPTLLSEFDVFDNLAALVDANSNLTTYAYNARKQKTAVFYPDDTQEAYTYDMPGRLVESVAQNGSYTEYGYDLLDRATNRSVYSSSGTLLARYSTAYNAFNVLAQTDANTNTTSYAYDGAGRLVYEYGPGSTATRAQTQYIYNDLSQVAERRVWFGTNATDYAATVYTYDNLGQVTSETVKDSGATTFLKTEYAYDAAGNRTAVRVFPAAASSGATTISEYDALNNLISVTDALTNRTTIAYDYSGTGLKTTVTDPLTNHVATARDALGRETTVEHRNMTNGLLRLTEYRYDPNGNRTRAIETVTGSNRVITTGWAYDSRNRPQIMTEALGSADERTTRYIYNDVGQLYLQKNPNGVEISHFYDARDRLENLISSDNSIRYRYTYDGNNNLLGVQDVVADRDTTRTFDEYNRIKTETQATGLGVEYAYDRAGRKTREFLPGSNAVDYVYNSAFMAAVRRMTNVTSLGVSGNLAYQHSYTSNDLAGNILGVSLASSQAQTFQTDSMNRRMLISGPAWTQTVASGTSGYDPAGNLKNFTVADPGSVLNFVHTYDGLYQLASEAGGASRSYVHDSIGNRLALDGGTTVFAYNNLNELLIQNASTNVLTGSIRVPVSGLYGPTKLSEEVSTVSLKLDGGSTLPATINTNGTWEYLDAGLRGLNIPVDGANHAIVATATTTNSLTNAKTVTVSYASATRASYVYDRNGNLVQKTLNGSNATVFGYAYDALNRLVSMTKSSPTADLVRVDYGYDPFDRLISKVVTTNGVTASVQRFLWDGENEIGAADGTNRLLQLRILGAGLGNEVGATVAFETRTNATDAWSAYVPIHDHRGNVVVALNRTTGTVAEYYRYDAFGRETILSPGHSVLSESAIGNPWRFSSKRVESENGLVYFTHRWYDPEIGRFINADPFGFADGPNRYVYGRAMPLTRIDPDGRLAKGTGTGLKDLAVGTGQLFWDVGGSLGYGAVSLFDYDLAEWIYGDQAERLRNTAYGIGNLTWDVGGSLGYAITWGIDSEYASDVYGGQLAGLQDAAVAMSGGEDRSWAYRSGYVGSQIAALYLLGRLGNQPMGSAVAKSPSAFESMLQTVDSLDFSTPRNGAVFYSGPGQGARATAFAERTGGMTIEMTQGGRYLSENLSGFTRAQQDLIWQRASTPFAEGASGRINAFIKGADPSRTFRTIEEPLLDLNSDVIRAIYHY